MTDIPPASRVVLPGVRIALATGIALSVTACTPTGDFVLGSRNAAAEGPAPLSATPASARDVEAPEVFDVAAEGLWDGRPSLGGVWVAHPKAVDPERVMIRNTENDRFVIGALFRRERDNPGPPIQVSSEAAAALDLLAGNPTTLQVTALRREEAVEPEPRAEPEPEPSDTIATVETDTRAEEVAAAALDAVTEPATDATGLGIASATTAATTANAATRAAAPAGGLLGAISRVFRPAEEAVTPEQDLAAEPEPAPAPAPSGAMSADDIASGIETAAFSTAALTPAPAASTPAPIPAALRVPAPARLAPTSLDTPLDRAFVQVGLYAQPENAEAADRALRRAGLVPTIREEDGNGVRSWRVLVGPAPTAEDRDAVLDTVRGAGFEDAYFVSR